jgi:hypothetical protein
MRMTFKPLIFAAAALTALTACGSTAATTTKTTTKATTKPAASVSTAKPGSATTTKSGVETTAKPGTATTGAKDASSTTAKKKSGDAGAVWAQCMRDNGVKMEDPKVDAKGATQLSLPKDVNPNSPEFQAAMKKCETEFKALDVGGSSATSQTDIKDALVAFTACLRKEGLDVGDADLTKAGGGPSGTPDDRKIGGLPAQLLETVIPRFDSKNPKTEAAVKKCAPALTKVLPGGAGGGA